VLSRKLIIAVSIASAVVVPALLSGNAQALSAHECRELSGTPTLYLDSNCTMKSTEGKFRTVKVALGWFSIYPTITSSFLISTTVAESELKIQCTGIGGSGSLQNIESGGLQKVEGKELVFELSGCSVSKPAGCSTPATIKTVQLKALSEAVGEVDKINFTPASGTAIATIKIEGCAAEGSYKLTGTLTGLVQAASPPSVEFSATSSALKFGLNAATLTGLFHWATISDSKTIAFERP
jgi:hypothetical protein